VRGCQSHRQSCSLIRPAAGQQEAHQQGSEHSTSPRAVSFLMGSTRYVPMYPRTQSPPAHIIPHLALGSSTTQTDRRRAHPRNQVRTWPSRHGGTSLPHGRPGWLRHRHVSLLIAHGHLGKYFCLVPGPVKSRPCRDHAVTAVQTPEVPLAFVPGLRRPPTLLMPSLLPCFPPATGHGRPWQRALTDRLTPLQYAFWPSFCRNG
jgi:hypothetical protein